MRKRLQRVLPFLAWFPMSRADVRADVVAGVTVALVLVPQAMAYAQLAGMPAVNGLYTAFLPVVVAALFGSSRQLATGPVAMAALLTAAALTPLAAAGSETYIQLAVLLALLVGVMRFALGVFRLGVLVSFLSLPVLTGFSSAAAIIIAASQIDKLLDVPRPQGGGSFIADAWGVALQAADAHVPTVAMAAGSIAALVLLRRYAPRLPAVLIVVAAATAVSAAIGFERNERVALSALADDEARGLVDEYLHARRRLGELTAQRAATSEQRRAAEADGRSQRTAALAYELELIALEIDELQRERRRRLYRLRQMRFERVAGDGATARFVAARTDAASASGAHWKLQDIDESGVLMRGGGEVVGHVPAGLPPITPPSIDWAAAGQLASAAFVIALIGFMEAISIAKAMAARTRQRIDANQELIGQGLANVVGAFTQCFPTSGSFSRSALALAAGARSGVASVVTALVVAVTLLFLTPLMYHLPQATLAAVIIVAVVPLVNVKGMLHAWRARRPDGAAAVVTLVVTLAAAPRLEFGILSGVGLSLVLFLYRTMRPRVALLQLGPDGTLRESPAHDNDVTRRVVAVRFDGQLYFANVPYFEDSLLAVRARFPHVREILVIADGINQIDASGDDIVRQLVDRLRSAGVRLSFSGLKPQVREVLQATGTLAHIGADNLFGDAREALLALQCRAGPATCEAAGAGQADRDLRS